MGAGKAKIKQLRQGPEKRKPRRALGRDAPLSYPPLLLPKLVDVPDMSQPRPRYVVDRAAYSVTLLDEEFEKKERTYPVGEKLRNACR